MGEFLRDQQCLVVQFRGCGQRRLAGGVLVDLVESFSDREAVREAVVGGSEPFTGVVLPEIAGDDPFRGLQHAIGRVELPERGRVGRCRPSQQRLRVPEVSHNGPTQARVVDGHTCVGGDTP
ncbi:hypothetical protein NQK81_02420 [Amycolatopsis roodepoortensis]|uniref:hypothetical protein n=1 Tax=Amycolatopsis roodepoortensis TaxID=700274 RepID=UPI00214CE979|nr:hypothetical protein [Amycolatopsis roodepoortensis]UUV32329.1 hypothetical protein NQK81_02420 [Amycolatopsis roodepoortensis]